jgi:hypothetical protein
MFLLLQDRFSMKKINGTALTGTTQQKRFIVWSVLLILALALMANLGAIIDAILHPDIEYFDSEHVLVGMVTASVVGLMLILLIVYIERLEKAFREIKRMEGLLPICSSCKKIRTEANTWVPVERYITEKSDATLTHGICPECYETLYSHIYPSVDRK